MPVISLVLLGPANGVEWDEIEYGIYDPPTALPLPLPHSCGLYGAAIVDVGRLASGELPLGVVETRGEGATHGEKGVLNVVADNGEDVCMNCACGTAREVVIVRGRTGTRRSGPPPVLPA